MRFKFTLILLLTFISCQETETVGISNQDIENAKNWFIENQSLLRLKYYLSSDNTRISQSDFVKEPDWRMSKVHRMKNGIKVIEVLLNYRDNVFRAQIDNSNGGSVKSIVNSMILVEVIPR
jgi:hypothetical protein